MHILYIDNDPDDCHIFNEAVKNIAADADVACLTVMSGQEGLEMLKHGIEPKPDLIFLDVNMPGMDGLECLTEIRSDDQLKHLPGKPSLAIYAKGRYTKNAVPLPGELSALIKP